jgi:hypothetical protein
VPLELHEAEVKSITVEPGEAERGPTAAPAGQREPPRIVDAKGDSKPAAAPSGNGKRTAGFVVGGIGAASLGVGLVTGIMALSKASTVKDHCDASLACDPQGVDAGSSGKTLSLVSTVTILTGAAAVGVGAFLILTSPKSAKTSAVLPVFVRDGGGVALLRRF